MTFYSDLASEAYNLINEFGQTVTISRVTRTIDPVVGTTTSTTATGSFKAVNPPASQDSIQYFDNGTIQEAQNIFKKIRFLTVAALNASFVPMKGDKLTMGGVDYSVFGCTPVSPGGTDIVYKIGVGV